MKKSVLINLLVITIVVTIFVFVGMWYLQPGVPNEILQQAKERQLQPLMEVTPPVKKPTIEEVSQTETLARELLPRLQEELEPILKDSLSAQLLGDTTLLASLAKQLEDLITPSLNTMLAANQEAYQDALRTELSGYVEENLAQLRTEATGLQADIERDVAAQLEAMREEITQEVEAYVPQLVDRMIPQLVTQVVEQLETNKDTYIAELQASLPEPGVSTEEAIALYDQYRSDIVMDLVPSLLDSMEVPVRSAVQEYLVEMKFIPPVPTIPTPKVTLQVDEPEVVEVPPATEMVEEFIPVMAEPEVIDKEIAVPLEPASIEEKATPTVVEPEVIEEKPLPVVEEAMPVETEVETVIPSTPSIVGVTPVVEDASALVYQEKQEPIFVPAFEEKVEPVLMDPEEYEMQRQDIRTKAIQDVLDRIAPR